MLYALAGAGVALPIIGVAGYVALQVVLAVGEAFKQ
jgi:hypothetical protein